MSLIIPGFNASDFVKFSSCSASGEIDQTHNISKQPCENAIDSIVCDKDNGFRCPGNCGVTFELEKPETFGKIIIQNGVGSRVKQMKAFKLKVKNEVSENWQSLTSIKVKNDSKIEITDDYITLSRGQEYLEIAFKAVKQVTEIKIEIRDSSTKINEILIPRKLISQRQKTSNSNN